MKAIVLSGGGSKGSYQIGVWKALRKLHIKYDIVTGTSVGALNGALMVQNKFHKAIKLWSKINMELLLVMKLLILLKLKMFLICTVSIFLKMVVWMSKY